MGKQCKSEQPLPPLKTTVDCKNAIVAYEEGDYKGALRALRNCQSSYGDCAVYHHAEAIIHYKLAMQNEDSKIVWRHIEDAAISALQASSLFSSSIVLAHFHACTLYDLAGFNQEYEEVIQECKWALEIENPLDPESDSFIFKDLSQERGSEKIKQELRELMNKCERKKRCVADYSNKRLKKYIKAIEERVTEAENRITPLRKSSNKKFESSSWRTSLTEKRKKNKSLASGDKGLKVSSFWNSEMSAEEKRYLFEVRLEELKTYLGSLEDHKAMDLLLEAIAFSWMCKTWKFGEFCVKFVDWQSYTEHLYGSHGWKIDPDFRLDLLPLVDNNSVEMIMKGEWKPVDIEAVIKVMDNQFRLDSLSTDESGKSAEKGLHEQKECSDEDVQVAINNEKMVKHLLFGSRSDKNFSPIEAIDDLKWPLRDDRKHTALLDRVSAMFQLLIRYNYLTKIHVDWVINYTTDELKTIISDSQLGNRVMKTLKLVCFLGSSQLEIILRYLQCVSATYGLITTPKMGNSMDEQLSGDQAFDFREKVVLSEDFSCLITIACDGSAVTSANGSHGDFLLPGNDGILSWLYTGQGMRESLELWESLRDSRKAQAQYVAQTFASLLRKRQKELNEGNDTTEAAFQFELDFILNVLEEAQAVTAYQFEKDSRMQENLNLSDVHLQQKIEYCVAQPLSDVRVDNATIMRSIGVMKQYGQQLEQLSTYDYRLILLPILKSFMQSRLEDLVHKEAVEKSEAARKTSLSEFDAIENINKGSDKQKIQEKSTNMKKNKKKNKKKKDQREAKDFKANGDIEQPLLPEEKAEQIDHPELEIGGSLIANELEQQKAEVLDTASVHQMQSLDTMRGSNILGAGLNNEVGENTCFLNVIIQSLWHLTTFRNKFMSRSKLDHKHVGDPCVACALHDVFAALHKASMGYEESVNPTPLRIALSNLYTKHKLFKREEMNDARQVLEVILWRLHQSFTSGCALPDFPSRSTCDNSSNPCLVHEIFGMKIKKNNGHRLIHQSNHSEVIYMDIDVLRNLKNIYGNCSFEQIVKHALEGISKRRTQSDSNAGDGRKLNHAKVTEWLPPYVFRIVLEYGTDANSQQDISEICNSLSTKLDIGAHSQGLDPGNRYILISMVCYHASELHYSCFIYNHEHQKCVSYNDQYVEDIGNWDNVLKKCIQSRMLPYILIFETTNLEDLSDKGTAQKHEAAKEALSAQHALDAKKNINEAFDNERQKEDIEKKKTKKKKKKRFRKAKENKATGDRIGENIEGVSAIRANHPEDDKEKRFQADVRKAVRLSLDCFENQNGPLPSDVKDGTTLRLDVYRYVIIQSQWRLRQLQDEFMSRSEIPHIHNSDLCFLCAYRDSYTAIRIASKNEPKEASGPTPRSHSRTLPIDQFMKEWANKNDGVNEDATRIGAPASAYELENQLAVLVRNIAEELEQERQTKQKSMNWRTL